MPGLFHTLARAFLIACPLLAVAAREAAAQVDSVLQSMLGTISVEATPQFADGQLYGCAVAFNVMAQDWRINRADTSGLAVTLD
jgi:hypothetical protein